MSQAITKLLQHAVDQGAVAGVVAAVFNSEGTLYQQAAGRCRSDEPAAMRSDQVMAIMSMTKALTATAALQLVERGDLQLDAPAAALCPTLGSTQVLDGFSDSGEPLLRAPKSAITLRHLLTHTSGFVYNTWNQDLVRYMAHSGTPDIATLQKAALAVPLAFDPGTRWEYGIGIDWVGQMIEAASGQTLGAYFAEHLTGPLGMADTAFTPSADMAKRRAPIHMRQKDGSLKPLAARPPKDPEFEMGGGGLLSTAADYGRFIRMVLGGGSLNGVRVLQADSISAMLSNQIGDLPVTPLHTAVPALSNDVDLFADTRRRWSLAFQLSETASASGRAAGTVMWAGLANSYYWIDPASQLGGVFLTQVFPFVDQQVLPAYYAFENAAYQAYGAAL